MEAEAWKALKQAAIRFELKTGMINRNTKLIDVTSQRLIFAPLIIVNVDHTKGLNVHVSACRGERPVYEFTSSGKTNTYVNCTVYVPFHKHIFF